MKLTPAGLDRASVNKVIKILDHNVLGQLQVPDNQNLRSERPICSDNLFARKFGVNVICDICEGNFSNEHLPNGRAAKGKVTWILSYAPKKVYSRTFIEKFLKIFVT